MRGILMVFVAGLEIIAACVLLVLAWRLPGAAAVDRTMGRFETVSRTTGKQVRGLTKQVKTVRKRQPDLARLARRLEKQMLVVSEDVQTRSLSGEGLMTVSESLGQIA